nr:MAG TPA: hypothetical protein [Caudoviricetes sp.]
MHVKSAISTAKLSAFSSRCRDFLSSFSTFCVLLASHSYTISQYQFTTGRLPHSSHLCITFLSKDSHFRRTQQI